MSALLNALREEGTKEECLAALERARVRIEALEAALRPSAYTKARYIGEVKFYFETESEGIQVTVPWDATKETMAMILAYANREPGV